MENLNSCKNCSLPVTGNYCHHCGQKVIERFNIGYLWRQLHSELFELDRGLWVTFRDLTVRPGYMIGDYLAGKTRTYYSPLKYLLVWVTLYYLILSVAMPEWNEVIASTKDSMKGSFVNELFGEFTMLMFDNLTLYFLLLIPFLALSLHIFFRAFNPVEHFIILGFLWGHILASMPITVPLLSLPLILFGNGAEMIVIIVFSLLMVFGFFFVAYKQLTGGTTMRTIFRLITALYLGYAVFIGFLMLVYFIVRTVRGA